MEPPAEVAPPEREDARLAIAAEPASRSSETEDARRLAGELWKVPSGQGGLPNPPRSDVGGSLDQADEPFMCMVAWALRGEGVEPGKRADESLLLLVRGPVRAAVEVGDDGL